MNIDFTHILLTRFNLDYVNFNKNKINFNYFDWYSKRVDLFFKYSYPTIVNQNASFKWLVIFDESTEDEDIQLFLKRDFFGKIEILRTNSSNLIIDLNRYIIGNKNSSKIIITTNLDSDDGFLEGTINEIQEFSKLRKEMPFLINIDNGYIVDVNTGMFYLKSFKSNPFMSMIECDFPYKTCLIDDHHKLFKFYPIHDIKNKFLWIQNVHDSNVVNSLKGNLLIFGRDNIVESKLYKKPLVSDYLIAFVLFLKRKIINAFILLKNKLV